MKSKLFVFSIGLAFVAGQLQAQKGYTISPSNTLKVHAPANTLSVYDIYQDNITGDTIVLKWKKISIDVPTGWDYSLCDLGTCYGLIPDSARMFDVEQGGKGFLGFNVDPKSLDGLLTAKFYVYQDGLYSEGDTCIFIITAGSTGIANLSLENAVRIYPMPATGHFNVILPVPAPAEISIFSSTGAFIKKVELLGGTEAIDVSGFANGIYILEVTQGGYVYNSRFIKN